jgi:hypothetical protein
MLNEIWNIFSRFSKTFLVTLFAFCLIVVVVVRATFLVFNLDLVFLTTTKSLVTNR